MRMNIASRLIGFLRKAAVLFPALGSRPRRGGLFMLALFMGLSGALRLGEGVGNAFAETAIPEAAGEPSVETPLICEPDAGAMNILEGLREREKRLLEQESKAAEREQTISVARSEIDAKIASLQAVEQELAQTIALADQAAEKDVSKLVAMYESMKPKDAAQLFGEMDPDFAAGFLARMRPDAAGSVLAGLEPAKAYAISVVLAGRNAKAPKS